MLSSYNNIDFIKNNAFYLPSGYDSPEKLNQIHQSLENTPINLRLGLAWHLRDKPLLEPSSYWCKNNDSFLVPADRNMAKKVKINFNYQSTIPGKAIIYPTTSKRGFLKINKDTSTSIAFKFIKYMKGLNTSITSFVNHWDGNSLLFQMSPTTYLEITGEQVYTYTLPEDEEISVYYSPLQCYGTTMSSDLRSPHAFAVTNKNRLLYRGSLLSNPLTFPPTSFFSLQFEQYLKETFTSSEPKSKSQYGPAPKTFRDYQLPTTLINKSNTIQYPTLDNLITLKNPFLGLYSSLSDQLKLISIEYVDDLNPRFLYTTVEEVVQKTKIYPNLSEEKLQTKMQTQNMLSLLLPNLVSNTDLYQNSSYLQNPSPYSQSQNLYSQNKNQNPYPQKLTQQIMVNGYCDFELRVNQLPPPKSIEKGHYQTLPEINANSKTNGVIQIYDKYIWEDVQHDKSIQSFYGKPCYVINPEDYQSIFLGFNGAGQDFHWLKNNGHGNTILIHMTDNSYVQVSRKITRFSLPDPEDRIKVYYSPIGPNGVPYPFAITEKGFIVFEGKYIPGDQYSLPKTPLFSYLLFQQLYGNISNLTTRDPSKIQYVIKH